MYVQKVCSEFSLGLEVDDMENHNNTEYFNGTIWEIDNGKNYDNGHSDRD